MRTIRILGTLSTAIIGILSIACGATAKVQEAANRVKYQNDMRQIGLCMLDFHNLKQRMPKDLAELTSTVAVPAEALTLLNSGEVKVEWGPWKLGDQLERGSSGTLMAASNAAIFKGSVCVITADGNVALMTSSEMAALAKPVIKAETPKKR